MLPEAGTTCARPLPSAPTQGCADMDVTTSVGRVLSERYQVGELLGSGGMAAVWRGHDLRLDRAVAIKELAGTWLDDRDALLQFDREARIAARLAHPNIVAVFDVDVHDSTPFLVMEMIEGPTVAQLLTDGPLPIEAAVAIAAQACDGLAAAHAAGVIHRDVKPANLMLTDAAVLKVCDFGIASALAGTVDNAVTRPLAAMGTSSYMAPEQASGDRVDSRADLYGLGCTMYTMLAGKPPFHGTMPEVLQQHQTQAPEPLCTQRADVPPRLDALVMRLLAKDPQRRPTCTEVKAVLADLAVGTTPAVVSISGRAKVAMPTAEGATVGSPRIVSALLDRRWRARRGRGRVIRFWPFAAGLVLTLVLASATWRMAPPQTDDPLLGGVPSPVPTPTTTIATSSPETSTSAQPLKTEQASQPPLPSATQPSRPAPPADPIAALRLSVQQQVSNGNLHPDKADDLYAKIDAIAHAANAGNTVDEVRYIKAFHDRIDTLLKGGQLNAAGYDIVHAALDAVSATL